MAATLEKRMTDVEYIIAHLPDDLNARFAGVDVKFAAIRETQLLHTQRFSTIERKIDLLDTRMDGLEADIDKLEAKVDALDTKMDLILSRLPAA